MVSNATVSQAIEGVDFPTTGGELTELIERKIEKGILPRSFVAPVLELTRALPNDRKLMNMAHLWEEVGSVQKALHETGGAKRLRADEILESHRDDRAPMGLGELEADHEVADRVRKQHE